MPSNEGNEGNEGNSGNAGVTGNASSVSAGWFFADRIDLPFTMVSPPGMPGKTLGSLTPLPVKNFPDRNWAAQWRAWLAVIDFSQTAWAGLDPSTQPNWPKDVPAVGAAPPDWSVLQAKESLKDEIGDLVTAAANERADALGEIMSQADEFISYFLNLVGARPGSHPATTALLTITSQLGTFISMHYKNCYQRPRPSFVCPALLPPVEVPGHASFPSGHSTQAHLMALSLQAALSITDPGNTAALTITALADRIARNRELAGLHYPSDSAAGLAIANTYATAMSNGTLKVPTFAAALAKAKTEWPH